jgi:hypothetical protein
MKITVQHAGKAIQVDLPDEATPDDLRTLLVEHTGVLVRAQKLLHKGKVLPFPGLPRSTPAAALAPKVTLASLGISGGAKLMLLASGGGGGATTAGAAALAASRAAAAQATATKRAAVAVAAGAAGGRGGGGGGCLAVDWAARGAVWAKTGVITLRDAGLTDLPEAALGPAVAAAATAADLGSNRGLAALPPAIGQWTRLTRLRLSGTGLAALPDSFAGLTRLETVLLDRAALAAVPPVLRRLPALRVLSLAHNPLLAMLDSGAGDGGEGNDGGDASTAAPWPPCLEVLDVSHCRLTALPAGLGASCPRLSLVDARTNAIGPHLPPDLGRVATLRLDANRVEGLPPGFLGGPTSRVAVLSLRDNPITAEALRATDGFAAYDARRVAAANKRLAGRTVAEGGGSAFSEGADALEWMPFGPQ